MRRTTKLLIGIITAALFLLAAVTVEVVMVNNLLKARAAVNWPIAKGTIRRCELIDASTVKSSYEIRLQYDYQVQGNAYQGKKVRASGSTFKSRNEAAALVQQLPVGLAVSVYYNPNDPADALLLVGAEENEYLGAIFPPIFICFIGFIMVLLIIQWRKAMRGEDITQDEDYSEEPEGYRTWGPQVRIHCPSCKKEVDARTYHIVERQGIPYEETYVECLPCGVTRSTKLPLMELDRYSANELNQHLFERVSFVVKFLAIASVTLFLFPVVGLVLSGVAYLASYRLGGWPKRLSLIGLCLSGVVSLVFVLLVIFVK